MSGRGEGRKKIPLPQPLSARGEGRRSRLVWRVGREENKEIFSCTGEEKMSKRQERKVIDLEKICHLNFSMSNGATCEDIMKRGSSPRCAEHQRGEKKRCAPGQLWFLFAREMSLTFVLWALLPDDFLLMILWCPSDEKRCFSREAQSLVVSAIFLRLLLPLSGAINSPRQSPAPRPPRIPRVSFVPLFIDSFFVTN